MVSKTYPNIGTVHFSRKRICKKISLRVKSNGEIYVSLPMFCPMAKAEAFLLSQTKWVQEHQKTIHDKKRLITESAQHFTHFHNLEIVTSVDNSFRYKVTQDVIKILIPNNHNIEEEIIQKNIQSIIVETLRAEAKTYIPKRVEELATQHGFCYAQVKISSAKTRWGCCNSRKSLTFSLFIMTLPYHLIDFVILHELCHTIHMNHSEAFYALHNQCLQGKLKEYEKEIKTCRMDVFPKW